MKNQHKTNLTPILIMAGVILSCLGTIIFSTIQYLNVQKQQILNSAVDGCLKASLYRNVTNKSDGSVVTTEDSIQPSVQKCLELKKITQ